MPERAPRCRRDCLLVLGERALLGSAGLNPDDSDTQQQSVKAAGHALHLCLLAGAGRREPVRSPEALGSLVTDCHPGV
jgi:hypothetical protein